VGLKVGFKWGLNGVYFGVYFEPSDWLKSQLSIFDYS